MTEINRYTYYVNEPEDLKELLDFWIRTKDIYYPVFIEWETNGTKGCDRANFWLETELYRVGINVGKTIAEELYHRLSNKYQGQHKVIECCVYVNDKAD
ncbi:MAG: hypothetical protein Q8L79_03130 [Methylobacter sp.]|uniref:hypothetical protein n=1 Tax=Methylobacter sp. TaxID=2051955 RepID=UPI0027304091|nr:hypothetical protein [Methylobacter sp.]MDP1664094.1 hypothetical protein [Methylobacter sp.]